ncbi:hypothetical protein [Vallitalea okinawensis]|uniref:hypothetical protein n=1 Tax=Vallitalea okinawensis TaxID=2078660 RepID=UPI000CFCE1D1|nr:hypothetical protein [Vallitalea okinawensis]
MRIFGAFKQYQGLPKEIYILSIQRFINSVGGFVFPFLAMFLSKRLGFEKNVIGVFMLSASLVGILVLLLILYLVEERTKKKRKCNQELGY